MQPKLVTVREAVIGLNAILFHTDDTIFVAPDQTRIGRAKAARGQLRVFGMFTHKWITLRPDQQLGIWRGPRCVRIYRWIAPNQVEIS